LGLVWQEHNAIEVNPWKLLHWIGHFEQGVEAHGYRIETDKLVIDLQYEVWRTQLMEEGRLDALMDAKRQAYLAEVGA